MTSQSPTEKSFCSDEVTEIAPSAALAVRGSFFSTATGIVPEPADAGKVHWKVTSPVMDVNPASTSPLDAPVQEMAATVS